MLFEKPATLSDNLFLRKRGRNFSQAPGPLSFDGVQVNQATKFQKSPGSRMSVPLGKLVLIAGTVASGSGALLYYLIQKTFSRTSYYQLALEHLQSHPEAREALGPPLNTHYLHLTDRENFVDIAYAQLKIPVSGSKSEGYLHVSSSRDNPFTRHGITFLEGTCFF
ncbi:cytochrome c oxidase assembly factor 1 homolog isoform X2 [Dasypus novemcinctus]|uniref:cytochrome c oxidase assembly factor 1 homolog isoform X2 n=1 Tax=Dasypus novemcinctus TaxID=9361 RepID=UPI000C849F5B|nr:cytochrome c oxidase assembly factor 1 homolog isoform X2 [Dasypus novemcinctus]